MYEIPVHLDDVISVYSDGSIVRWWNWQNPSRREAAGEFYRIRVQRY